jgi:hypothetical protein
VKVHTVSTGSFLAQGGSPLGDEVGFDVGELEMPRREVT